MNIEFSTSAVKLVIYYSQVMLEFFVCLKQLALANTSAPEIGLTSVITTKKP